MDNRKIVYIVIAAIAAALLLVLTVFKPAVKKQVMPLDEKEKIETINNKLPFDEENKADEITEESTEKIDDTKTNLKPTTKTTVKTNAKSTVIKTEIQKNVENTDAVDVDFSAMKSNPRSNVVIVDKEYKMKSPSKYRFK